MIRTANLNVDPELCKRLDKAVHGSKSEPSENVMRRYEVMYSELLDYIRTFNVELADRFTKHPRGLYYLYCAADRVRYEWGRHNNEMIAANGSMATRQLNNFKWEGLR